tara:strand:- start:1420 stop:2445 length:1026 start_codon:yes stop_codon:yes gene_type:complete
MNIKSLALKKTDNIELESIDLIQTEQALRALIPSYPKMLDKRIQRSLDYFSLEFIHVAKVAFLASNSKEYSMSSVRVNFELKILDNTHFLLTKTPSDIWGKALTEPLTSSLYFIAPGLGHGLRINGSLRCEKTNLIFNIEQVYFHCARAAARAELWLAKTIPRINESNIIQHSPFLLLKTMNSERRTEISPRGDEPGFVKVISKDTLLLPERPGNKIAVSLRNIIICPDIELLFIVPNSNKTINITGTAKVISDQALLGQCMVKGKMPKTGILIEIKSSHFQRDLTLAESDLWNDRDAIDKASITSFSKALSAHINGTGLLGKATNAIVGAVVKHDMKHLY